MSPTTTSPATTTTTPTTTSPTPTPPPAPVSTTPPPDYTLPAAFDARDVYPGQVPCKAFDVLDQGGCNSCYAFAAASSFSARLCRSSPTSLGNAVVSPQQLMDCSGGCAGGNEATALSVLASRGDVELWCDPYQQKQGTCGSFCSAGNKYAAVSGSVRSVGGAGPAGVIQMQYELVRGGPGVVSFIVMSDFFSYAGGVYTPSAGATEVGGHAVSLVGWGVDKGVPYWLCQNSWGPSFGEGGFFRILRGADTCTIESRSGLVVARPVTPTACPNARCANGAVTLADCTCRCDNGKTGPTCSVCALTCQHGGVLDSQCTACTCPLGYSGRQCENGYSAAPLATCAGDSTSITATYSFASGALPPTQASLVGIYAASETNPYQYITATYLCGASYVASLRGGLCPTSGTVSIPNPLAPGQYKLAVAAYLLNMDSFGDSG